MRTVLPSRRRGLAGAAALMAAAALSACNLHIGSGVEAREDWARSYTVRPGATLEVRETNGRIRVAAIDGDTITVTATRVAKAATEDAAKAALKDLKIAESAAADRVELDSTMPGLQFALQGSRRVDFDIKVPRSVNVVIKTTNGEVDVQGVGGALTVEAVNGRIAGSGLGGGATVTSVNGKVDLDFVTLGEAGVQCRTTNGQIIVSIPRDAKATLAARVVNGVVRAENLAMEATEESHRRLDATIGGGGPEVRLQTTNGEVRLVGK